MQNIVSNFKISGKLKSIEPYKNGLVNKTFLVITSTNKYLLQRINKYVFKDPNQVMKNINFVTNHLKSLNRRTLNIIKTKANQIIYFDNLTKEYYRLYDFLDDLYSISLTNNPEIYLEVGKVIGNFQSDFSEVSPETLVETIPKFHYTINRINYLKEIIKQSKVNMRRFEKCKSICEILINEESATCKIQNHLDSFLLPIRIVHNDTKLNNIMFDKASNKGICLIDLDTVMPGTIIFDFSDAVRSSCATLNEDDPTLYDLDIDDQKFVCLLIGYLSKSKSFITDIELELLIEGIKTIIYECAVRFITDYLENDIYFKTNYQNHNLTRAINQLKLYFICKKKEVYYKKLVQTVYFRLI